DALAALSKGVVQFSILVEPFVREAEKLGYKSLVDVGSLNIPFHWNGVLTRQANVQSKSPLIAGLTTARWGKLFISTNEIKDSTLKIISKYTHITDPDPCILSSSQNLVYFMVRNKGGDYGDRYRREAVRGNTDRLRESPLLDAAHHSQAGISDPF